MITGVVKAKRPASGASRASSSSFGPSRPVAGGQRSATAAAGLPLLYTPAQSPASEALLSAFENAKSQPEHERSLRQFEDALDSKKSREAAFACLWNLSKLPSVFPKFEPYILALFPKLLEHLGDKDGLVRDSALAALKALESSVSTYAVSEFVTALFVGLSEQQRWQTKTGTLALLNSFASTSPTQIRSLLPQVIPHLSNAMWDTKSEVKVAAKECLTKMCTLIGNPDIENVVPEIVDSIVNPDRVPEVIDLLGLTTFVKKMEAPTLTIMVPLLIRALVERSVPLRRKTGLIIESMCKLVDDPEIVAPFLPSLLPCLKKTEDETADPDCLEVLQQAHATLLRVGGISTEKEKDVKAVDVHQVHVELVASMMATLKAIVSVGEFVPSYYFPLLSYAASIAETLVESRNFDKGEWSKSVIPYLEAWLLKEDAEKACSSLLTKCLEVYDANNDSDVDEEGGEDVCNCRFGLAYGSKILLHRTNLHLIRGRRYGLCGANGVGKSTLMRAIGAGQVEGFPSPDEVRTVYVEHDIDGTNATSSVFDFVVAAIPSASMQETVEALRSVGFTDESMQQAINSLSGGWKMKLALARAMLKNAEILLLDEPTNHLDVANIRWLEDYLVNKCQRVTSMIVSHDSGFLDNVCTDIIHYHNFQLKRYKGTLSDFVKKVPSAKSYYDLSASVQKYTFPKPGLLDGVKTQEKAILRLRNVTFCYPGSGRNQLEDVSVQLSLGSRVAVLGRNGAGKSTLIKLMTSELAPDDGTVWKHPNLRIAYVAQHAFHHIEQHLDMTPNAYIQWRFASGEDAEEQEKTYRQVTEEDLARMKQAHMRPDGIAKVVDRILARQKYKNSFQYEISWVGYPSTGKNKKTTWLPRETLEEMGLTPKLLEFDSMYAAEQSYSRPLNLREVEKHLIQFGLNPEFGTHAMIQGLSGGQKVRLVIAAAMWNRPHMLVLDEPTNFLDRDSVAALAAAIKEYQGAVVMITHNEQFYQALCTEKWHVADGKVTPEGQKWGSTRNMALEEREKMHLLHAEEEQAATDAAAKAKEGKVKSGTAGGRKARKDLERKKKLNHGVLIQQEHVTGDALVPSNLGLLKKP